MVFFKVDNFFVYYRTSGGFRWHTARKRKFSADDRSRCFWNICNLKKCRENFRKGCLCFGKKLGKKKIDLFLMKKKRRTKRWKNILWKRKTLSKKMKNFLKMPLDAKHFIRRYPSALRNYVVGRDLMTVDELEDLSREEKNLFYVSVLTLAKLYNLDITAEAYEPASDIKEKYFITPETVNEI